MMMSSNGNIFRVTGHLCGEFTSHRWIPRTKASDVELWCFFFICAWINGRVNNREAVDLRRHRAHHDLRTLAVWKEVMKFQIKLKRDISLNYSLISIPDRPEKSKLVQCIPQIIYAVWDCSLLGCSYIVSSQESLSLTWFNFNPNKDE